MNDERYEGEQMVAFAHAIDPALTHLEVEAHNPIQGEAMHKVIGWHARKALVHVGWMGPYGIVPGGLDVGAVPSWWQPIYIVRDPTHNDPPQPEEIATQTGR